MKRLLVAGIVAMIATSAGAGESFGPYRGTVLRILDGDTVEVEIAVWPGLTEKVKVRLAGINTPDLRGTPECEREAARKSREFTRAFLAGATAVIVREVRLDKYAGRVVGRIVADGNDLSEALLKANLARPYAGGRKEPWC